MKLEELLEGGGMEGHIRTHSLWCALEVVHPLSDGGQGLFLCQGFLRGRPQQVCGPVKDYQEQEPSLDHGPQRPDHQSPGHEAR